MLLQAWVYSEMLLIQNEWHHLMEMQQQLNMALSTVDPRHGRRGRYASRVIFKWPCTEKILITLDVTAESLFCSVMSLGFSLWVPQSFKNWHLFSDLHECFHAVMNICTLYRERVEFFSPPRMNFNPVGGAFIPTENTCFDGQLHTQVLNRNGNYSFLQKFYYSHLLFVPVCSV